MDKNLNRIMNKDKNIIKLNIVVVDKSKSHPKEEVFPWILPTICKKS